MPVRVSLATSERFACVTLEGAVTWSDIANAMRGLYGRPDADPSIRVLWDGRAIRSMVMHPEDLREMKALRVELAAGLDGGRTAVVVRRELDTMMAHLFSRQVRDTRREHRVFRDLDAALTFLGLDAIVEAFDRVLLEEQARP